MAKRSRPSSRFLPRGFSILYEDADVIAVDKPAGLLTMGTDKEKSRTAYFALTDYVRKGCAKSRKRIFIVHRLDRDTSGVIIFAKNHQAKIKLQGNWSDTKKTYLAVVHGQCEKSEDTITSYLTENKARVVYSTSDKKKGKLSHTAYKVLKQTDSFALLAIDLLTGRKNQIRVHMADREHPIVGDKKYGKAKSPHKRLALHSRSITFNHPTTGKQITIKADVPSFFNKLVGRVPT